MLLLNYFIKFCQLNFYIRIIARQTNTVIYIILSDFYEFSIILIILVIKTPQNVTVLLYMFEDTAF